MAFRKTKQHILWIAWRQVISRKGRNISFMTIISITGVAIGVAALVVILSVMGGFERDLKERMFRGLPHAELVNRNQAAGFSLLEMPISKIKNELPETTGIEPYTQSDVVIKRGKNIASLTLFGIDPDFGGNLWGFSSGMIEGEIKSLLDQPEEAFTTAATLPGIILGESLAMQLGASVGDEVKVLSPQASISDALGGGTFSSSFRVVGLFLTDLPRFDTRYGVVSLKSGRKFLPDFDESLESEEFVTGIAVNFPNPEMVDSIATKFTKHPDYKINTWKTVNKSLLFALKLEKFTMGAILLLIVIVAAFSISGTMMMTVYHKRRQVAILRSLGMSEKDIGRLFLTHGFAIGTIGVTAGIIVGIGICIFLDQMKDLQLPAQIFYQRQLPVAFLPFEYVIICFCAWMLSLFAAFYPARVAAKQAPASGLRYM